MPPPPALTTSQIPHNIHQHSQQPTSGHRSPPNNLNQPEHIHHIVNCLHIAKRQLYIIFNPNNTKAPKDRSSTSTMLLKSKINALINSGHKHPQHQHTAFTKSPQPLLPPTLPVMPSQNTSHSTDIRACASLTGWTNLAFGQGWKPNGGCVLTSMSAGPCQIVLCCVLVRAASISLSRCWPIVGWEWFGELDVFYACYLHNIYLFTYLGHNNEYVLQCQNVPTAKHVPTATASFGSHCSKGNKVGNMRWRWYNI